MKVNVHITGAAGSGVTTLGRALAGTLGAAHLDTDFFYWVPTQVPFTLKRPVDERLRLIAHAQAATKVQPNGTWVLSGSLMGWGEPVIAQAGLVVFLSTTTEIRMDRLIARERALYGGRILPGGDMEEIHRTFVTWAQRYEDPDFAGRSRTTHDMWLSQMTVPVLRLDSTETPRILIDQTLDFMDQAGLE